MFVLPLMLAGVPAFLYGQGADKNKEPDTLVLSNGDTLHGKLVQETNGTVTFHSDPLGDLTLAWDKIESLQLRRRLP